MLNHPTKGDVISDMKKVCKDKAFAFSQKHLREVTPRSADWISSKTISVSSAVIGVTFLSRKKSRSTTLIPG